MNKKINAGIVGAAGYTGGELIRLLLRHPSAGLAFAQSRSQAGKAVSEIHTDLLGDTDVRFTESHQEPADVLFICLSHGESRKFLTEHRFPATTRIIDLGNDFRIGDRVDDRSFVYGLPEFHREEIKKSQNVANPGCFATAIQLGLLPLAEQSILGEVHTTGITGSTGAGQKLQETTHFTWRSDNISAYKTLTHQHLGEINQTLKRAQPGFTESVNFVPWRGDFTRGIYVSSIVTCKLSHPELTTLFKSYYAEHPFTHVSDSMIDLKQVVNTNKCLLHVEKIGDKAVIHSALDNLLKGASGQAIQNMNLMFGINEEEGLNLKGSAF